MNTGGHMKIFDQNKSQEEISNQKSLDKKSKYIH